MKEFGKFINYQDYSLNLNAEASFFDGRNTFPNGRKVLQTYLLNYESKSYFADQDIREK